MRDPSLGDPDVLLNFMRFLRRGPSTFACSPENLFSVAPYQCKSRYGVLLSWPVRFSGLAVASICIPERIDVISKAIRCAESRRLLSGWHWRRTENTGC